MLVTFGHLKAMNFQSLGVKDNAIGGLDRNVRERTRVYTASLRVKNNVIVGGLDLYASRS